MIVRSTISIILFFFIFITPSSCSTKKEIVLDEILAIVSVSGGDSSHPITRSYIEQASLDGSPRSLERAIDNYLICEDGRKKYGISPKGDVGERAVQDIMKKNNLTRKEFEAIVKQSGYTIKKAKEELALLSTVQSVLDFVIKSRLIVSDKDIETYYNEHPLYEETKYILKRAYIPISKQTTEKEKQNTYHALQEQRLDDENHPLISWGKEFSIFENDLDEEKRTLITSLNSQNPISAVTKISEGFELFKLVEKRERRPVPLANRYSEIANALRRPLYEERFKEYIEQLRKTALIVYK
jgi:peptidyl-prolyl cis-trans isomerase SurA